MIPATFRESKPTIVVKSLRASHFLESVFYFVALYDVVSILAVLLFESIFEFLL